MRPPETAGPFVRLRPAADRRLEYGALAAVTLVGFVLRLSYLDVSMHWGEAVIASWTRHWPFLDVATYYGNVGNHLLHTLLVDLCHALFGPWPWSVRLPALLPGVALIPATFFVASKLFSRGTALVAAGLAAGSPYLVHYSINSRGYMLQSLLILLLTWLLIRVAESPSRRAVLAAGVVGALALHTLPTTIYVLPGLYAGAALWSQGGGNPFRRRDAGGAGRLLAALFVTGSLALVLYLPVLLTNEWEAMTTQSVLRPRSFSGTWWGIVDRFAESAGHWTWSLPFPAPALYALVAGAGLLAAVRRRASSALLVLLAVASTAAVALLLRRVPQVRGHLFLMPFFLIVLAAGIEGVLRRIPAGTRLACPLAAVLLAAGGTAWTWSAGWHYAGRSNPEGIAGAESAVRVLATVMGGRDRVTPGFVQLRYYAELHGLPVRFTGSSWRELSDDVDNFYLLVRSHRETLREVVERRGLDRGFSEPLPFGVFSDLQVFVFRKLVVLGGDWYPEEGTPRSKWRWIGRTATVSFPNPRADATFHLDYAARPDLFGEAPQVVTISVGGRVLRSFAAAERGRRRLRIPVPAAAPRPGDRTEVRIAVDRTFVPAAAIAGSSDRRELGIQVHHAAPFLPP